MNTYHPSINRMLISSIIDRVKQKSLLETDNYIDVSRQLEIEAENFKKSLEKDGVPINDLMVEANTMNNSQAFYVGMVTLIGFFKANKYLVREICIAVNSRQLTHDQIEDLMGLMGLIFIFAMFSKFRNAEIAKVRTIKRMLINFHKSLDMTKYNL